MIFFNISFSTYNKYNAHICVKRITGGENHCVIVLPILVYTHLQVFTFYIQMKIFMQQKKNNLDYVSCFDKLTITKKITTFNCDSH